jgi:dethiobiotin synthase
MKLPDRIFITGTDTEVGKTVVAAMITLGLRATYWKPIQSNTPTDTDFVKAATGLPEQHFIKEAYSFSRPLSPHLAAAIDGVTIDMSYILRTKLPDSPIVIEGAGGVLVPLNDRHLMIDLIVDLGFPTIVVARSSLGTINHTLLTVRRLRDSGVNVFGVVMNGILNEDNKSAIERYGNVPVIAQVEPLPAIDAQSLQCEFQRHFALDSSLATTVTCHAN